MAACLVGLCGGETAPDAAGVEIPAHPVFAREKFDSDFASKCPLAVPKVFENSVPAGRLGDNQTLIR